MYILFAQTIHISNTGFDVLGFFRSIANAVHGYDKDDAERRRCYRVVISSFPTWTDAKSDFIIRVRKRESVKKWGRDGKIYIFQYHDQPHTFIVGYYSSFCHWLKVVVHSETESDSDANRVTDSMLITLLRLWSKAYIYIWYTHSMVTNQLDIVSTYHVHHHEWFKTNFPFKIPIERIN